MCASGAVRIRQQALGWRRAECDFRQKCPQALARGGQKQMQDLVGESGEWEWGLLAFGTGQEASRMDVSHCLLVWCMAAGKRDFLFLFWQDLDRVKLWVSQDL